MNPLGLLLYTAISLLSLSANAELEKVMRPLGPQHVYQRDYGRLGLAGEIYCGPAAATESLAFLKWHRDQKFSLIKWSGDVVSPDSSSDDYLYVQTRDLAKLFKTTIFAIPGTDQYFTDPVDVIKGLRQYLKDSGYSDPWVFTKGFRAFDAPEGNTLDEMKRPVKVQEIREYMSKGYGVILLIGFYRAIWSRTKHRFGGHFVTVTGYSYDTEKSDEIDLFVTDSLLRADQQPRKIHLAPIKREENVLYPDYVSHEIDSDNSTYLDSAIFFIPQVK